MRKNNGSNSASGIHAWAIQKSSVTTALSRARLRPCRATPVRVRSCQEVVRSLRVHGLRRQPGGESVATRNGFQTEMTSKLTDVLDEQELINRMRRGEQRAFDHFSMPYAARLGAFAARRSALDAAALEDVVQMTMINAMRSLGTFRGGSALFTWLCQICRNQLADARRKAARQPRPRASISSKPRNRRRRWCSSPISAIRSMSAPRIPSAAPCAAPSTGCPRTTRAYSSCVSGTNSRFRRSRRVLQVSESAAESRLVSGTAGISRRVAAAGCRRRGNFMSNSNDTDEPKMPRSSLARGLASAGLARRPCSASGAAAQAEWREPSGGRPPPRTPLDCARGRRRRRQCRAGARLEDSCERGGRWRRAWHGRAFRGAGHHGDACVAAPTSADGRCTVASRADARGRVATRCSRSRAAAICASRRVEISRSMAANAVRLERGETVRRHSARRARRRDDSWRTPAPANSATWARSSRSPWSTARRACGCARAALMARGRRRFHGRRGHRSGHRSRS